jgi:hypothetical protein
MEGAVLPDDVRHILVSVAAKVEEDHPDLLFGATGGQDVAERIDGGKEYVTPHPKTAYMAQFRTWNWPAYA